MSILPHFLVIPFPVQGHVNPLMQFSQVLAKHGCKVTFLHTEFNHKRSKTGVFEQDKIQVMTLPDGLESEDDRSDIKKVILSIKSTMPSKLPKLIEEVNALNVESKINCIVVTFNMGWALEVGHNLGIKGALLFPASATTLACGVCVHKLIEDGIIDSQGNPTKKQEIQISPDIPMMDTTNIPWRGVDKILFDNMVQEMQTLNNFGEWWLCNTTCDLEPGVFSISPKFLPIGPLMESNNNKSSLWQEDSTCLDWLDKQAPQSVIYVSFGSLVVMDQNQFNELALGLDLLDKPFLWVVRPSNDNKVNYTYPNDFHGSKGKIVGWAPQSKILNHPAIACFISHCGWNSTIEGVHAGVPFLCWPFSVDQFLNKSYICDVWKTGLELEKDDDGYISRKEIKKKVYQVVGDDDIKAMCLKMKKMTITNIEEGGQSSHNLQKFITWANY
ncbi:putative UDP-glucuronosyl/UDP-glucosyltransferase [Medicago truncatula]|uniref:Putative UDP-glucuronosyl/UDP-glucosyltransferase n=1 Tax=Medicago truncatula TaxID=3880 RepID=G7L598_MEDTR|nr:UDP-glycosyltransferase 83A1 [Medicago truncatula]AES77648.1 UDP-glucosyltransferase family protein [Medicago truncatula]RHN44380.1 putative UDP-glucuronosyl/UDP-glucosyltransferase [Medicago truncatula]